MSKPSPGPAAAGPRPSITVQVVDPTPQTPAIVALQLPGGERAVMYASHARSLAIILGKAADLADELQTIQDEVMSAVFGDLIDLAQAQARGH